MAASVAILTRKVERLGKAHVLPFERWRSVLSTADRLLPHIDPDDGGDQARLLILLETPGPGAEPLWFVSMDNPTGTARNLRLFLEQARLVRTEVVLWNAVPWVVHAPGARNRPLRRSEVIQGLELLPGALALLTRLRVVVLAGHVARHARSVVERERPGLPVLEMPHPSPTIVCTSPGVPSLIQAALAEARAILDAAACDARASAVA